MKEESKQTSIQTNDAKVHINFPDWQKLDKEAILNEIESKIKRYSTSLTYKEIQKGFDQYQKLYSASRQKAYEEYQSDPKNANEPFEFVLAIEKRQNELYKKFKEKQHSEIEAKRQTQQKNTSLSEKLLSELKEIPESTLSNQEKKENYNRIVETWKSLNGDFLPDKKNLIQNNFRLYQTQYFQFMKMSFDYLQVSFDKNKEEKKRLLDLAQKIVIEENPTQAIHEFNTIFRQWRELGSAGKESENELWSQLMEVKEKVQEKIKQSKLDLLSEIKKLDEKSLEICSLIENLDFSSFKTPKVWKEKSELLEKLVGVFIQINHAFSHDSEKIWRRFKEARRIFAHQKNLFFKQHKKNIKESQGKKQEIIQQAKQTIENDERPIVIKKLISLQKEWKNQSVTPNDRKLWEEFRTICNNFFENIKSEKEDLQKSKSQMSDFQQEVLKSLPQNLCQEKEKSILDIKEALKKWQDFLQEKNREEIRKEQSIDYILYEKYKSSPEDTSIISQSIFDYLKDNDDKKLSENFQRNLQILVHKEKDELAKIENNAHFFRHSKELANQVNEKIETQKIKVQDLEKTLISVKKNNN